MLNFQATCSSTPNTARIVTCKVRSSSEEYSSWDYIFGIKESDVNMLLNPGYDNICFHAAR